MFKGWLADIRMAGWTDKRTGGRKKTDGRGGARQTDNLQSLASLLAKLALWFSCFHNLVVTVKKQVF